MKKVLKHFKNNAAIYLVLLLCIVVTLIVIFHQGDQEIKKVDTSKFRVISIDKAIKLFDDSEPKYLVVSTSTCSATREFVSTLEYSMVKNGFTVYYLNIDDLDLEGKDKEKIAKLGELFDLNYTYEGKSRPLIDYLGYTPMNVIIKNRKAVYAYIGTLNVSTLDSLAVAYNLGD